MATRLAVIGAALLLAGMACASGQKLTVASEPLHLNPIPGAIVIELDEPRWKPICFRQLPTTHIYTCAEIGTIQSMLEQHRKASTRSWPMGKIRALLGF